MKKTPLLFTAVSACLIVAAASTEASQPHGNLGLGIRRHNEHSKFDDLPFGKRDLSVGLSYEFHEKAAFWQLGLSYTPDMSVKKDADEHEKAPDYALTPELNLVAKDDIYHAGVGIASTYTSSNDESEWTSVYWQFMLGVQFDVSRKATLSGYAYYPFADWNTLDDFRFKDVEYGIRVGYRF